MLLDWYKKQIKDLGVRVQLGSELSAQAIDALEADEVIVASGAKPRNLDLAGADKPHVMEAIDYLCGRKEVGQRVVVVGAA